MIKADAAIQRLREGNLRFVANLKSNTKPNVEMDKLKLPAEQTPFAIILGCSDARVPAEIVFDQGLGDLFVIRVAGNVVAPSQVGSVEFAAQTFGTQLVVVLGHNRCGAVQATLDQLENPDKNISVNIDAIVDRIRPAVETLLDMEHEMAPEVFLQRAVEANIRASVNHLKHGSTVLETLIQQGKLTVAGARYCLDSGTVQFL